eukprot:GGOE01003292.1.p1 GENE.GGOE01003292.1~~GGOE01003292.1.p1  ORF type:complete len:448 (+),score=119.28 GGOE01003292.1:206-1549(+)
MMELLERRVGAMANQLDELKKIEVEREVLEAQIGEEARQSETQRALAQSRQSHITALSELEDPDTLSPTNAVGVQSSVSRSFTVPSRVPSTYVDPSKADSEPEHWSASSFTPRPEDQWPPKRMSFVSDLPSSKAAGDDELARQRLAELEVDKELSKAQRMLREANSERQRQIREQELELIQQLRDAASKEEERNILMDHRNRLLEEERVLMAQLQALGEVPVKDVEGEAPPRRNRPTGSRDVWNAPRGHGDNKHRSSAGPKIFLSQGKEERLPSISGPRARSKQARSYSDAPVRTVKPTLKPYVSLGIPFPSDPLLYRETKQMARSVSGPPVMPRPSSSPLAASYTGRPSLDISHRDSRVQEISKANFLQPIPMFPSPGSTASAQSSARQQFRVAPEFENETLYDPMSGAAALAAIQDIRRRASQIQQAKSSPGRMPVGRLSMVQQQ